MASPITLNSSAFLMLQQLELVTDSDGAQHGHTGQLMLRKSLEGNVQVCASVFVCVSFCSTLCLCLVSWPYLCQVKSHVHVQLQLQQLLLLLVLLLQHCLPLVCPKWPSCYCCYDLWHTHIDQRFAPCHGHHHPRHAAQLRLTLFSSFSIDFLVFYLLPMVLRP